MYYADSCAEYQTSDINHLCGTAREQDLSANLRTADMSLELYISSHACTKRLRSIYDFFSQKSCPVHLLAS